MPNPERLAEQIGLILKKRIEEDRVQFPPFPPVATKVVSLTRQADFALKDAAALIERDALLAAQVMRVANSPGFATRQPATSIQAATSRLGIQNLRTVVLEYAARTVFDSRDRSISEACKALWEHSLAVASLGRDVSVLLGKGDPETAYLAGLLHDIGKPLVASVLLDAEGVITKRVGQDWITSKMWVEVVQGVHRNVGVQLCEKWQIPSEVVDAVRDCGDYDVTERESVSNIVRFANALAKMEGIYVGAVDRDDVEALLLVGRSLLGMEDEVYAKVEKAARGRTWAQAA